MSTTIASVLAQLLVIVLPMMGMKIGSDELTVTIQTIVVVVTGVWIWFQRVQRGDVGFFGKRIGRYDN